MCRNRLGGGVSLKGYALTVVALFSFCSKYCFPHPISLYCRILDEYNSCKREYHTSKLSFTSIYHILSYTDSRLSLRRAISWDMLRLMCARLRLANLHRARSHPGAVLGSSISRWSDICNVLLHQLSAGLYLDRILNLSTLLDVFFQ